jgi:cytochrome bd ubiquinol oxidase subunit II
METFWFAAVAYMLTMYVILDGFDLGAGIIYLAVGRNEAERDLVHRAIGPVWDGNEVWLIAGGGVLYLAFPLLYASSFSGFYLPLMIVLWLLMLRGLGIEMRHHGENHLWRSFWDGSFALGSILLSIFFGAALGNVVRGVPLNDKGYFFEPLWTSFTVQPEAGILDWFTVLMGLVSFFTLTAHGANYVAMKTEGVVRDRSRRWSSGAWWGVFLASAAALTATWSIRPGIWENFIHHPWGYIFPALGAAGLAGMKLANRSGNDTFAFLSSASFIAGMMASTAFALFPDVLPSSGDPSLSLTVYNTASGSYALGVGVVWWMIGMAGIIASFTYLFFKVSGKVKQDHPPM